MTFTNQRLGKGVKRATKRAKAVKVVVNRQITNVNRRVKNRLKRLRKRINKPSLGGASTSNNVRRPVAVRGPRMTQAGMNFLKCAFAPPDFTSTQVSGVPDSFRGNTLLKKHRLVASTTFTSTYDYYFILAPIPGVAYLAGVTLQGVPVAAATVFNAVNYSDFSALFPSAATASSIVSSFRFISNHFELICTSNQMVWSGAISTFKLPIQVNNRTGGAANVGDLITMTGLDGINSTNANMYNGTFYDGVFTYCFNNAATFNFTNVIESTSNFPAGVDAQDFGQFLGNTFLPGFDNSFEALVVKVSGISANETATIKTWACVEYKPSPSSSVYEYSTPSPPEDDTTMRMYREIALSIPVAVPFRENANFWQRVLSIIRSLAGAGAMVPGPVGMISGGVSSIATGISNLAF